VIISLALVLLVTASGTLATYLYDEGAAFAARLCAGACIGLASLGLIAFVFASFLGLTPLTILLTLAVQSLPLILLRDPNRRAFVKQDLTNVYRSVRRAGGGVLLGHEYRRSVHRSLHHAGAGAALSLRRGYA